MGLFSLFKKEMKPDYTVIDIETSGLSSKTCEIIEISAIKVKNHQIISEYSRLIKPHGAIDPKASQINGITEAMLINERPIEIVLPDFLKYIQKDKLLGYNISTFDIPILTRVARSLGYNFVNEYEDIVYLAREKLTMLPSCSLSNVAGYFTIDTTGEHRALQDCRITNLCYEKLLELHNTEYHEKGKKQYRTEHTTQAIALQQLHSILLGITSDVKIEADEVQFLQKWLSDNSSLSGQFPYDRVARVVAEALDDGILEDFELQEMQDLFTEFTQPSTKSIFSTTPLTTLSDKCVVLSGDFEYGYKDMVKELIEEKGGIVKSSVSGKTDYLIVGEFGSADWSNGNYGTKIKKAIELQDQGKQILIVKESLLMNFLGIEL